MKRIFALVCAICLLATAVPMMASATPALTAQTYTFSQMEGYYKTQGRVELSGSALNMDTSSSGFEFYYYGRGDVTLTMDVYANYTSNCFFSVIVDGTQTRTEVAASNGSTVTANVTLATGLAEGYHHIEVYKQTEASSALVAAKSITFTGSLTATPPSDKITIEVIGDSISGGASNLTTNDNTTNPSYPVFQDGTATYAYLTGQALGANVRVTQTSGYGCVSGWNSNGVNLQDMYPYTSWWRDHTESGYYDFDPAADIVIINLGTNDYTARNRNNLTDDAFKEGAMNLMKMAKTNNNGAAVVWCTGMMGVYYPTTLAAAIDELGGAEAGYYYCELPQGQSGGEAHPNVSEHAAAAQTLTAFLLETILPENYQDDFATASELQATLTAAQAVKSPDALLTTAITMAQMELDCGTTDEYRLGCRLAALESAMNGTAVGLDLMPVSGVSQTPTLTDGSGVGHYVWPYYADNGTVTLYKGGEGHYWPYVHTEYMQLVDVDDTPYITMEVVGGNAVGWNVHIAYLDSEGNRYTVTMAPLYDSSLTDFTAPTEKTTYTVDFGSYVKSLGHTDSEGYVRIVGCDIYVVCSMDQYLKLYTCAFTGAQAPSYPTTITGPYTVSGAIVSGMNVGVTVEDLIAAMDHSEYLVITEADGSAATGALKTGMLLKLTIDGDIVDEVTVSVRGDVNGDGVKSTSDARLALKFSLQTETLSAAAQTAADMDSDGSVNTSDVRRLLKEVTNG